MTSVVSGPATSLSRPFVDGASTAGPLLTEKLRIPQPGVSVLPRLRVAALLDAAVSHPVTVLTGPPGAGKTVAAAQWAGARPVSRRPAWVTLDSEDADPARFWQYVLAALADAGAPTPPDGLRPDAVPRFLTTLARAESPPVVLVLDDIQLIAGSAALAGLDELVRHEPAGLRLLLAGRSAAGLALARLRLAGDLAEVGPAELACTGEEIAAYFSMVGAPLRPVEREEVVRRTEGWLAGLRLIALSAQVGAAASAAMTGDYLQDEVLARLPDGVRGLLLRTSLTPTVPADLARDLTGDAAAARLLEQLSRDNNLVQPVLPANATDRSRLPRPEAGEYRYHPMLRDVLAALLRRELPDELPDLQRRVAHWHAARGDVAAAVQAAADVGDWDFGTQVLRRAGPSVMLSPAAAGLEATLAGAPADRVGTDPVLATSLAAARLWQGDADGSLPHLESAQYALGGLAGSQRQQAELWLGALRVLHRSATRTTGTGGMAGERALAAQAHDDPRGGEHQALGVLWLALGFAALREFDIRQARSALLHAVSQLSAGGLIGLRERGKSWEAVAAGLYGDLGTASRLSASVADGPHGRDDELAPVLALAGAAVSLARDELDEAGSLLDLADVAATTPRPAGEPSIAVLSGLLRTRLAIADGNLAGARGLVRWLADAAAGPAAGDALTDAGGPHGPTGAVAMVAMLDAEISLAAGERERARATLADVTGRVQRGTGTDPAVRAEAAVCQARLLIADEDDKAALKLVEPLLADPAGTCSSTDRIRALLTAAVAHRRLSQQGEAAELLSEALVLAEPEDACGPFLAAGAAVRSALTVLISPSNRCAGFAGRILDRFDGRLSRPAASQAAALLTDSELAVLRFLPSHMTNQEIAESLFLSINTIKTHLSSVYRKLGVANRRQAIAQGRRLELLLARHRRIAASRRWRRGSPSERDRPRRFCQTGAARRPASPASGRRTGATQRRSSARARP